MVLFASCETRKTKFVVVQITRTPYDNNHLFCDYMLSRGGIVEEAYVTDTCGKYDVGDTLVFQILKK